MDAWGSAGGRPCSFDWSAAVQMAGHPMLGLHFRVGRSRIAAVVYGVGTAGVEVTAGWPPDGTRYVTRKHNPAGSVSGGVRNRNRRQKGLGVRVQRRGEKRTFVGEFDHPPQVHDRDPVADVLYHGQSWAMKSTKG